MAEHAKPGIFKEVALGALAIVLLGAGGIVIVSGAWRDWRLLREAPSWPRTDGLVVESRLVTDPESLSYVRIEYAYSTGGQHFRGDARTPAFFVDEEVALARHPVGALVPIHYDPEDPSRSVLGTWLLWNHAVNWVWLGFGGVLVAVCALVVGGYVYGAIVLIVRAAGGRRSVDEARAAVRRLRPGA